MTVHQAILYGEKILAENGVDQPRWNAERLLLFSSGESRSRLYSELTRELSDQEWQAFLVVLRKRAEHYPLAYIEGTQDFFGRSFRVNETVLIPRPETEEIVHLILNLTLPPRPRILDLCSGSGNLAATLAFELPTAFVVALELSASAMAVLRSNVEGRASVVRADYRACPLAAESMDVITANPPYVENHEFRNLPAETGWEPSSALLTNSLELTYQALLDQSAKILRPGGYLAFEMGFSQMERIRRLCEAHKSFRLITVRKDQRSIPRAMLLQRG